MIDEITDQAKISSRKRMNYNFHDSAEDTMHRMINVLEPGSYVQPHKHENPDKREAFIILRGKVLVVIFNDSGIIEDQILLDTQKGNFGVEIPPKTYHMIIPLEPGSTLYEIKDGPYNVRSDKKFADWAPKEGENGVKNYIASIIKKIDL